MKNTDDDSICSRLERLINEFEQSKEIESTEIGRQFAVSSFVYSRWDWWKTLSMLLFFFFFFSNYND